MDDETQTPGSSAPANDADTVDTQTSEADVQTNIDTPEAPQDTKDSDVKATDTVEEKLYAGKYKTPEEMEQGYKNLESKFGKEASEKAELTRILNEAFATPTPIVDTDGEDDVETAPQTGNDEVKRDMAVLKFIIAHQDADGESMKKVLATDPMIKQISGHDAKLEYAYLRSQSMSQPKAIEEAKKTAQAETQAKHAEKQAAQVESAKKAEPIDEGDLLSKATAGSPAEAEAARKALIKKHLINL